ncbi:MAG: hypothetical protein M9915_06175 [Rhizobacter sp.]|nr:hypothetical protein [Rhizobacter sp.]
MKPAKAFLALVFGLNGSLACANESTASEVSHLISGALIASAATALADHYDYRVEDRGWVGFWTSVGISFVSESVQVLTSGSSQVHGSALDFGYNLVGAAIGAYVTDRYILQPVVTRDAAGNRTVGVAMQMQF